MIYKNVQKIVTAAVLFSVGFSVFLSSCERHREVLMPNEKETSIFVFGGVILDPNYKPAGHSTVTLVTKNGTLTQKTDEWGHFVFRVSKGTYEIIFHHSLYEELKQQVVINSENIWLTYRFTTWKRFQISGKILKKDGIPIPKAMIFLKGIKNHIDTLIVSDQNGQFLSKLRGGDYSVFVSKFSYRDTSFVFRLESDSVVTNWYLGVSPDYFPLHAGNRWEYDFSEISNPSAGATAYQDSGRQVIKILSRTYNSDVERRYEVEVTFSGIRKYGIADWGMFRSIDSTKAMEYRYTFEARDHLVDGIYFPIKLAGKYDWKVRYRHFIKASDSDINTGNFFHIHQEWVPTLIMTKDLIFEGEYEKAIFAPKIGLVATLKESSHHDRFYTSRKKLIDFYVEK